MKNIQIIATMISVLMFIDSYGFYDTNTRSYKTDETYKMAAGCSPATSATDLDVNNVKALIQTGGDMWWDFVSAKYEVPKGAGTHCMFAGALWLGGKDVSGQLKVAAQTYRSGGQDYWTGPLSTVTSEIEAATCRLYDKHFVSTRDEVAQFSAWWECQQDPDCDESKTFPNYQVPQFILDWPAHGRTGSPYNEDWYLAPFYDRDGGGTYDPLNDGDYPGYDLNNDIDCSDRKTSIYGDKNLWWIFNDKGNVHTESGCTAIGMEIRAQAFGFATNDEVNNMTFYNYELVNRSTFTLTETYFGVFFDADIGNYSDDFVGCDVQRGLGYCYNGNDIDIDLRGAKGYGVQPPAVGVDFFEGPYQDNDGLDNPLTTNVNEAIAQKGIPYKGLGIGYGDGVIDNERFGMARFVYFTNPSSGGRFPMGDPDKCLEYYNYLRGIWQDGTKMVYGGTGHVGSPKAYSPSTEANYMFPGDTDPLGWGTKGTITPKWTEELEGNSPGDRRFLHSAGPFTLQPGAVNDITVGVVWDRATTGGPWASVEKLRKADDKTQAMFDNCFRVPEGPHAPEVTIQELDKELILYITNPVLSNNYNEEYAQEHPFIIPPDSIDSDNDGTMDRLMNATEQANYKTYRFQGYQIFQLKHKAVSPTDLHDPDLARLAAQCDIKDTISQIINFYLNDNLGANVPVEEVNGENKGIVHSFQIKEDLFAEGDRKLVNHKTYYFMVLAYSYNSYKKYDPLDPSALDGQTQPYLASRKAVTGPLKVYNAVPHIPQPESGGTGMRSEYGDGVEITRIEGQGNVGNFLEMKEESIEEIFSGSTWKVKNPTYEKGKGPVHVKVIDPLRVPNATFTMQFLDSTGGSMDDAYWRVWKDNTSNTVYSDQAIKIGNEQILPNWGLSITIEQTKDPVNPAAEVDFIDASLTFKDAKKQWLTWVTDVDGMSAMNWIRSGSSNDPQIPTYNDRFEEDKNTGRKIFFDTKEEYENILEGGWAPFALVTEEKHGPMIKKSTLNFDDRLKSHTQFKFLKSVDIVFTTDKSKWTRCAVIEMQDDSSVAEGNARKGFLRKASSVDKNGNPATVTTASTNPNDPNYISATGMGWFPGYAIDIESGERLNMAFGEDSWLAKENGKDMLWNPTSNLIEGATGQDVRFGGKHYIFVFRNNIVEQSLGGFYAFPENRMPSYDAGKHIVGKLDTAETLINSSNSKDAWYPLTYVWGSTMWVGFPLLVKNQELLSTEAKVKIRINRPYEPYGTGTYVSPTDQLVVGNVYYVDKGTVYHNNKPYKRGSSFVAKSTTFIGPPTGDTKNNLITTVNGALPMYKFTTKGIETITKNLELAKDALDLINVVPNPYYAFSGYETDKLDNRIKFTNLPQTCTVTIYNVDGTLIRTLKKDDNTTSIDWDLKNHNGVPIAGGMYFIHVDVPGVGEKVLKWFGVLRPVDLDTF